MSASPIRHQREYIFHRNCASAGDSPTALLVPQRSQLPAGGAAALAHSASGSWKHALLLLRDMDADDTAPTTIVLCNVLNACAVGGAWEPALALLRGMKKRCGIERARPFPASQPLG